MLDKHVRIVHNKERPFKCQLCGSSFGQKVHLDAHINAVHIQVILVHSDQTGISAYQGTRFLIFSSPSPSSVRPACIARPPRASLISISGRSIKRKSPSLVMSATHASDKKHTSTNTFLLSTKRKNPTNAKTVITRYQLLRILIRAWCRTEA